MKAVIMAGGKGTRLSAITNDMIPKPMVKVLDKPILEHQVLTLKENGINDFIFIVGHLKEHIIQYFGDGSSFGVKIEYITEEYPLGTAGALSFLKEKHLKDDFLIVFGDTIFDIDIQRMVNFHHTKQSDITLFIHPNNHPFDSDIVLLDDDDRVIGIDSKNNKRTGYYQNLVNAGFYLCSPDILSYCKTCEKMDLDKDLILNNLKVLKVYGYQSTEYIKDVGTVDRIKVAENDLKQGVVRSKNLKYPQKAVFLDRDGTVNVYKGLISRCEDIELIHGVSQAISLLNQSKYLVFLVTNQPVVARNLCSIQDVKNMHNKIQTLLGKEGAYFDGISFCPHHPDKGYEGENPIYKVICKCRKPNIGMLNDFKKKYNINFADSYMIGDTTTDIQTGINANCKTVLVSTGENGSDRKYKCNPNLYAVDLLDAVKKILSYSS